MFYLECLTYIHTHLHWYLLNDYLNYKLAGFIEGVVNDLVKDLSVYAEDICFGFGIPQPSLIAPIYTGYEKYYSVDRTDGEHHILRPKF